MDALAVAASSRPKAKMRNLEVIGFSLSLNARIVI
jgi:hypothetical protein